MDEKCFLCKKGEAKHKIYWMDCTCGAMQDIFYRGCSCGPIKAWICDPCESLRQEGRELVFAENRGRGR